MRRHLIGPVIAVTPKVTWGNADATVAVDVTGLTINPERALQGTTPARPVRPLTRRDESKVVRPRRGGGSVPRTAVSCAYTAMRRTAGRMADMSNCWLLAVIIVLGLGGCAGLTQFPDAPPNPSKVLEGIDAEYKKALDEMYESANTPAKKKDIRNKLIETRMAVIDDSFKDFRAGLVKENVRADFGIALLAVGVGAAGSLVAETASQILSAVSGGLAGAQAAYGKAVLYERTMSALLAQMQAGRKAVAAQIFQRWNLNLDQYPMWMARTDLEGYYFAGSLPGAILATAADAKLKETQADLDISKLRKSPFSEDQFAVQLTKWLFDADQKPIENNVKSFRAWMDKNGLKELAIQKLLDNPDLKELREKAIKDLAVP